MNAFIILLSSLLCVLVPRNAEVWAEKLDDIIMINVIQVPPNTVNLTVFMCAPVDSSLSKCKVGLHFFYGLHEGWKRKNEKEREEGEDIIVVIKSLLFICKPIKPFRQKREYWGYVCCGQLSGALSGKSCRQ